MCCDVFVIVPMTPEHVAAVARIERESSPSPWSEESFLYEIEQPNSRFLVAKLRGEVVGHIGLWLIGTEAHIATFAVDKAHRRQGIGEALLRASLLRAIDEGVTRATLEVRASNIAAQNLYRKFGFVPIALRKGYYAPEREDAIIMWLDQAHLPTYRERIRQMRCPSSFSSESR